MQSGPISQDILLLGGGHAHVFVLKAFGMRPMPGVRLTLVAKELAAPYSGMLPGFVAGHYTLEECEVDLVRLAQFAGARVVHGSAIGIDRKARRVSIECRPPLRYDVLSIDVGITPQIDDIEGADRNALVVKPVSVFAPKWQALEAKALAPDGPRCIAAVGGGAAGVELILAARQALRHAAPGAGIDPDAFSFALVAGGPVLPSHNARARALARRALADARVEVIEDLACAMSAGAIKLASGRMVPADAVLVSTKAKPPDWFAATDLPRSPSGFLAVRPTLQLLDDDAVFAAGDCADVIEHPREKSGVFAVRQGPVLAENLRLRAQGRSARPFKPQKQFLSLISLGDKRAIASRGPFAIAGAWAWAWKDRIDRAFVDKFNALPAMKWGQTHGSDPESGAMRCGGCAAKVGPVTLAKALDRLDVHASRASPPSCPSPARREETLGRASRATEAPSIGENGIAPGVPPPLWGRTGGGDGRTAAAGVPPTPNPSPQGGGEPVERDARDDAAIIDDGTDTLKLETVDFFRAFWPDPYVFGEIAANHAMSDIFAMGGTPHRALAIAVLTEAHPRLVEEDLFQLLAGARAAFDRENVALAGGHSSEGLELSAGFAVSGSVPRASLLRKSGLKPGDALILTKPLGTGILFAAWMRGLATAGAIEAALATMRHSNRAARDCLVRHGASAATDITGFGLAGHLLEMLDASGVSAELSLPEIPAYPQASSLARSGIGSTLLPENLALATRLAGDPPSSGAALAFLFDPQTSGGLLAGVPADNAQACVEDLRRSGAPEAAIIGGVLATPQTTGGRIRATGDLAS